MDFKQHIYNVDNSCFENSTQQQIWQVVLVQVMCVCLLHIFIYGSAHIRCGKKECVQLFAWGRLKTPAHAEPCHRYIWWMSHMVCVHNLFSGIDNHPQSPHSICTVWLNVRSSSVSIPLSDVWRISATVVLKVMCIRNGSKWWACSFLQSLLLFREGDVFPKDLDSEL